MKNDEWLTPPELLSALGPFDLPICLIAYGAANAKTLQTCGLAGAYVPLAPVGADNAVAPTNEKGTPQ